MNTPPVVPLEQLPAPRFAVGEVVIYENNGEPVEAVVTFVSALGLYVVRWPGHCCTAREGELSQDEMLDRLSFLC